MNCNLKVFNGNNSIIDKKPMLNKISEANDQFQTLTIDVMMYAKYKIKNGQSIDGLVDLLRKLKVGLLKIISSSEFLKALSQSNQTLDSPIPEQLTTYESKN